MNELRSSLQAMVGDETASSLEAVAQASGMTLKDALTEALRFYCGELDKPAVEDVLKRIQAFLLRRTLQAEIEAADYETLAALHVSRTVQSERNKSRRKTTS